MHSSSLSKPGTYITHNAIQPPPIQSEIWMRYASSGHAYSNGAPAKWQQGETQLACNIKMAKSSQMVNKR